MFNTITKKILLATAIFGALGTISLSPYRLAFKFEMDAVAAQVQTIECRSIQVRLNDAYILRDRFSNSGEPVPQWLKNQIADYEIYLSQYC